jgi:hypothetical protein
MANVELANVVISSPFWFGSRDIKSEHGRWGPEGRSILVWKGHAGPIDNLGWNRAKISENKHVGNSQLIPPPTQQRSSNSPNRDTDKVALDIVLDDGIGGLTLGKGHRPIGRIGDLGPGGNSVGLYASTIRRSGLGARIWGPCVLAQVAFPLDGLISTYLFFSILISVPRESSLNVSIYIIAKFGRLILISPDISWFICLGNN